MRTSLKLRRRAQALLVRLIADRSGIAAVEFAFIVPLMLVVFFATVELTSGIAADRKVTLVARTLSDLVSQATTVSDSDMKNVFAASYSVLSPFSATAATATITEVYVNSSNVAKVQWSKSGAVSQSGSTISVTLSNSSYNPGDTISIPSGLQVANTYLIMSQFSYKYVPVVAYYLASSGVSLSDTSYTRPRQSLCVLYGSTVCPTN